MRTIAPSCSPRFPSSAAVTSKSFRVAQVSTLVRSLGIVKLHDDAIMQIDEGRLRNGDLEVGQSDQSRTERGTDGFPTVVHAELLEDVSDVGAN